MKILDHGILHEANCDEDSKGMLVDEDFDSGITLEVEDKVECDYSRRYIHFLGFHPYKEIVFLWVSRARVVAYDLSRSKVQDLGMLHLQSIGHVFPYTPC
jgi:hypothetical protein